MLLFLPSVATLAFLPICQGFPPLFQVLLHDPLETPMMLEWGFKVNPGHVNLVSFHLENVSTLVYKCMAQWLQQVTQAPQ